MYVFNRYGQHLSTVDLLTGVQLYNFTYNVHSYFGRLLKVADAGGQQMTIRRDYKLVARDIWASFHTSDSAFRLLVQWFEIT